MSTKTPTLYEWAGGTAALENLTRVFYDKVLKDELLYPVFKNMAADHSAHVAHFIGECSAGLHVTPPKTAVATRAWWPIISARCSTKKSGSVG